ncbi:hypothetical protein OJ997_29665 [Solirubrobacter phytolaccae]|uniref:Lipoprotein n=1 Tax=Solirubrobacter phytolaccae TaxID=1404360 RepID=A0A9X3NFS9_9ACTN|nr:hypothetical protein [Solirubrobacter phytolaccae]MDA0184509.1 hypothetical protein [Solirubrobacter phytolaccae]
MSKSAVVHRRTAVLIATALVAAGCGSAEPEVEAKRVAAKPGAEAAVKKVVKRYMAAFAAGKGENACNLLTDEAVAGVVDDGKKRTAEEAFTLCADTITNLSDILEPSERKQLRHPKFTSVKIKGRTAVIRVTITDDPLELKYTDDYGWLIAGGLD